jgi:hypothetical protein
MAEVLAPTRRDISMEFGRGMEGMAEKPISLNELQSAREDLIENIVGNMPADHRRLLISIKRGEPDWTLLGLPGMDRLPAVKWRLENLAKMEGNKRAAFLARLSEILRVVD